MKQETIKVYGYSEGDYTVGMNSCHFEIDTGLTELEDDDKVFIIDHLIRTIWELHDNGNIHFSFSNEPEHELNAHPYIFRDSDSKRVIQQLKERFRKWKDF